jgi:hypothetical protein
MRECNRSSGMWTPLAMVTYPISLVVLFAFVLDAQTLEHPTVRVVVATHGIAPDRFNVIVQSKSRGEPLRRWKATSRDHELLLELPTETPLLLSCEGQEAWCPQVELHATDNRQITLDVFPGAVVKATVKPTGVNLPPQVSILGLWRPASGGESDTVRFSVAASIGSDGTAVWKVPAGRLDLRISAPGSAPVYRFGVAATHSTEVIPPIVLLSGGSLSGHIRDVSTGRAIAGAHLALLSADRAGMRPSRLDGERKRLYQSEARADERGFYQFAGMAPGRYWLAAEVENHASTEQIVEIAKDAETFLDDLWLESYRRLDVQVRPPVDPSGRPWTIRVRTMRANTSGDESTWITRRTVSGVARFDRLPASTHQLEILSGEGDVLHDSIYPLPPIEQPLVIELESIAVEGRLRKGDTPVAETRVTLSTGHGDNVSCLTNSDGRFRGRLARLPDGPLFIEVLDGSGDLTAAVTAKNVTVVGKVVKVDVDLGEATISGEVVTGNGHRVEGARVVAMRLEPTESATAHGRSDLDGRFELVGLLPGRYRVDAVDTKTRARSEPQYVDVSYGGVQEIALLLAEPRGLEIQLLSSAGVPVGQAQLSVVTPSALRFITRSDAAGLATVNVPPQVQVILLTVFAPSQMLWSTCEPIGESNRLTVVLPAGPTGTLRLPGFPAVSKEDYSSLFIVTPAGGVLGANDLALWRRVTYSSEKVTEASGVAPGEYRLVRWNGMELAGLVSGACYGSLPPGSFATLPAGGTLTLEGLVSK